MYFSERWTLHPAVVAVLAVGSVSGEFFPQVLDGLRADISHRKGRKIAGPEISAGGDVELIVPGQTADETGESFSAVRPGLSDNMHFSAVFLSGDYWYCRCRWI